VFGSEKKKTKDNVFHDDSVWGIQNSQNNDRVLLTSGKDGKILSVDVVNQTVNKLFESDRQINCVA
jgi:hypothetical protein